MKQFTVEMYSGKWYSCDHKGWETKWINWFIQLENIPTVCTISVNIVKNKRWYYTAPDFERFYELTRTWNLRTEKQVSQIKIMRRIC